MTTVNKVYNLLLISLLMIVISTAIFPLTAPLHEGMHYLQSTIDPDLNPVNISLYTQECLNMGALGYCQVEVTNPNLTVNQISQKFLFQEFICYTICLVFQELISVIILVLLHKKGVLI